MTLAELRAKTINPATAKPYTGEEVARACKVSLNTYFRWEWGTSTPGGRNLTKLEQVLPGSTHTLVGVLRPVEDIQASA